MRLVATIFAVLVAAPAFAQTGPSFDCAKAVGAVERTICQEPDLAKADREMAAAYTALADKLGGPAKDDLVKGQLQWLTDRNRGCSANADDLIDCLTRRYAARTGSLKAFAAGDYPFISEKSLRGRGKLGAISYFYDIVYPQFDGKSADFSALNAGFAAMAKKAAAVATPTKEAGPDRAQDWTHEQSFELSRPGKHAVVVSVTYWGYSGGAHGYGANVCTLVDLRSGKAVGPQGVFAAGDRWLTRMVELVGADLKKQFVEKPGFEEALQPANLAKLLREPGHYCWEAGKLTLHFDQYVVGPYVAGPYEVEIPRTELKALMSPNGPLGD